MSQAEATLNRLETRARELREGKFEKVGPGKPARLSEALMPGEGGAQGDLHIFVGSGVPKGYEKVEKLTDADRQLVFGNTQGAKHCLDSLEGVTMYRPKGWNEESLIGPYLLLTQERVINHPTHGPVTLPAGREYNICYPRDFDVEQKRAERSKD